MFNIEKYAAIKLGSKQYLVHEGDVIELERQKNPVKAEVLFYADDTDIVVGEPYASGISIKISVLEEKLGRKVRVARFKKKSRYEKVKGHRQPMSVVKVDTIENANKKVRKSEKEVEEVVEAEKKTVERKVNKKPVPTKPKKEAKKEVVKEKSVQKKPVKEVAVKSVSKKSGKNLKKGK